MYPLGLLILWLQIHLTYGEDLVVSWYAANLVPSPVVLGLGASAVWDLLTQGRYLLYLAVLFLAVISFALITRRERHRVQSEQSPSSSTEVSEAVVERVRVADFHIRIPLFDLYLLLTKRAAIGYGVVLSITVLWLMGGWIFLLLQGLWTSVATDVLAFLSITSGILLMLRASLGLAEGPGFDKRRFLAGFAVAFVGLLVSAVLYSGFQSPALPYVQMGSREALKEGVLLARTEEYWFVFDSEGEFYAIPNDSAEEVRFLQTGG